MKRALFRVLVLGAIVGLGMLAIAHAQRPVAPPQDESPANPLRPDAPRPVYNPASDYRDDGKGPVDTAPPSDNPLRQPLPRNGRPPQKASGQGQPAPTRIQLVAGEEPVDNRIRVSGGSTSGMFREPQLMPPPDDRYAVPPRAADDPGRTPRTAAPEPAMEPASVSAGRTSEFVSRKPDELTSPSFSMQKPDALGGPSFNPREECGQASSGTGQPGGKQLEGPQNARVTLQKIVPPEIQVGRPAVLRTVVHNSGPAAAVEVEVRDQIPRGTRLLGTTPPVAPGPNGELVWSLGTLKPDAETTVEMQIVPTDEGEMGSVASVRFQTVATARSIVTQPKLVVTTSGPGSVLAGDEVLLSFTASNPGSGVATGVTLLEHIPAGLKHPAGAELEYNVGDLKPGESRQLQLRLRAVGAGTISNVISARADGNLRAENRFSFEVASAKLEVALNGPTRRYLKREATYQFSLANPGTAPAKQVELVAYLPPGLQFVSANNSGRYDANTRAVFWQMDELPVNKPGTVELVTLAVAPGQFNLKVRGAAQRGLLTEKEQPVLVEGLAAVLFQLSHTKDPLEVGGETTYEISVVNQGSKASTNLQVAVLLPAELRPLAAEGPTRYTILDNKVTFESLPQLAPKSVAAFRVRAQGVRAGDLRVRCQLMTDEMQRPVVKEESTRVYADE